MFNIITYRLIEQTLFINNFVQRQKLNLRFKTPRLILMCLWRVKSSAIVIAMLQQILRADLMFQYRILKNFTPIFLELNIQLNNHKLTFSIRIRINTKEARSSTQVHHLVASNQFHPIQQTQCFAHRQTADNSSLEKFWIAIEHTNINAHCATTFLGACCHIVSSTLKNTEILPFMGYCVQICCNM
ncbi:Hypothetical_protein [Hexamita inflata]|uniref:Hypothetical_protein n=1 Tax=Hexamita inflata TaxID=28002 RepID=A0AA86R9Z5_9EUKA|nr:Hypothetical protein HINF_LOCUS12106 [Hexamita inflata]CAI9969062.1 Hypothetical protein HINF_LOCUS56707 [Hexamita inflata]CAI9969065.1 Hypothetical protein HINF_LOCUS56710 [Hexamita inflata]